MNIYAIASTISLLGLLSGPNSGCTPDADDKQSAAQQVMLQQATDAVGMPAINNFAERRLLKQILELRDQNVTTTTYIVDLNGRTHKLCDSVGYGLPYATQYTNPENPSDNNHGLPQADPNGLFSPASAEGTWVSCLNPATKTVQALYIEPPVIVSPFPLVSQ